MGETVLECVQEGYVWEVSVGRAKQPEWAFICMQGQSAGEPGCHFFGLLLSMNSGTSQATPLVSQSFEPWDLILSQVLCSQPSSDDDRVHQ